MSTDRHEGHVHEASFAFGAEGPAKTFGRRGFIMASAGGIAACMVAPVHAFASQNPTINLSGTASIVSGQYCIWNSANGRNSTLTITNASRAHNLTIAITGAPGSGIMVQVNGQVQQVLNNIFTLPPNSTSFVIIATGNFVGTKITINNITNSQNDATASIQVVS